MRSQKIEFANACRGIAALSVVIVHLAIAFWLQQPQITTFTGLPALNFPAPAFALWLDALPINFAAFGVALFFVVSGFVIPISLERYDARAFLAARFVRIWPTYWAGFSVTLIALALGAIAFGGERPFNAVQAIIHYFPPLRVLLYSKPLDGIIWTLEIEFFWYMIAACIAGPLRRGSLTTFLAPVVLLAVFGLSWAATAHAPPSMAKLAGRLEFVTVYTPFLIFIFCGVALNFRQRGLVSRTACAALLAFCVALFLLAVASGKLVGIAAPGSYLAALGVFIAAMAFQDRLNDGPILRFLANVSYPLYVEHGFAGFVLLHALVVAGWTPLAALTTALTAALALAWVLHKLVETPSHRLAQHLSRAWSRRLARKIDAAA